MSEIIELIKVLRDRTGAGLMDCKKALQENDNDVEKATVWLREKGIAKQAKKLISLPTLIHLKNLLNKSVTYYLLMNHIPWMKLWLVN